MSINRLDNNEGLQTQQIIVTNDLWVVGGKLIISEEGKSFLSINKGPYITTIYYSINNGAYIASNTSVSISTDTGSAYSWYAECEDGYFSQYTEENQCHGTLDEIVASFDAKTIPPISLTITGSWTNEQKGNNAPDPTGLIFTVYYSATQSKTVTNVQVSPATWNNTQDVQTATFSYTEGETVLTATKTANIIYPVSLSINGDWAHTQMKDQQPDPTGLVFTCNYTHSISRIVQATLVNPSVWPGIGTQTATFRFSDCGINVNATKTAQVIEGYLDTIEFEDIIEVPAPYSSYYVSGYEV